jgi:hypothetical protein
MATRAYAADYPATVDALDSSVIVAAGTARLV